MEPGKRRGMPGGSKVRSLGTKMGQDGEGWATGKLGGLLDPEFIADPTVNIKCSPNQDG